MKMFRFDKTRLTGDHALACPIKRIVGLDPAKEFTHS